MGRISAMCFILTVGCIAVQADEPSKTAVKKLAKELADATIAGDYAKVMDYTYPTVIKESGGRKAAIESIEAAMERMKKEGIAVKKVEVGEPGDFYTEGDNTFVVLPNAMEMSFPGALIRMKSYVLGISSDGGKSWKFVDGAGLKNKESRKKVLPKMPAKLNLPETGKPEIIKRQ